MAKTHATACPNAPEPPEAPKGYTAPSCEPGSACAESHKPAPAPEPQWSDFECDTCGLKSDDLAIVGDLRAEVERLKQELEYVMADGLEKSAQLAQARKGIAYWKGQAEDHCSRVCIERSDRERAEARVKVLEDLLVSYVKADVAAQEAAERGGGYKTRRLALDFLRVEKAIATEACAILARKGESK